MLSRTVTHHGCTIRLKATIDGALADGGRLMAEMITAGQESGVLPQTSQRAIERVHECLKAGLQMRALAVATHHDLRKIMGRMDLDIVGFGDVGPTPSLGTYGDEDAGAR